jgi:hypothetical protein
LIEASAKYFFNQIYLSKKEMEVKLTKILKTTILTTLIVGISVVKFYNPVFAGPEEDFNLGIRLGELIKKGEFDSAAPLIEKMEDKDLKNVWLGNLVGELIKKGEFDSAAPLIEKMEDKDLKDALAAAAIRDCLKKGEMKKASEFLLYVENEDILTPLFLRLLSDYWDEKGFLGTSWFVLRFTFSGKIFQIKW